MEISQQLGLDNVDLRSPEQKFERNPFTIELKGRMYLQPRANTIIAKGQALVDTTTGEVIDEAILIGKRKIVDKSQFAKLYMAEIATLYELNKPAQNVFLHLTKVMDYDNKAYINSEKDCEKLGYKTGQSVIKGLKELIKHNIIAPAVMPGFYWLNPAIVCKGERFAKYVEYVVGKEGEELKVSNNTQLKQQGVKVFETLPEEVQNKMTYAGKAPEMDSYNEYLPFPDNNPY